MSDREPATAEMLAPEGVPLPAELLEVALDHASLRVPTVARRQTADEVRRSLIGSEFSSADDVVVLEGEALVGMVPIERLLAAPGALAIEEILDPDPPFVDPECDQRAVAAKMVEHHEVERRRGRC